jgi:hypothetical protein
MNLIHHAYSADANSSDAGAPAARNEDTDALRPALLAFNRGALCWSRIAKSLLCTSSQNEMATREAMNHKWLKRMSEVEDDAYHKRVHVTLLDRPSHTSALVSWKDPTRCSYGYQLWCLSVAKRHGFCSMSGHQIKKGDSVYRPRAFPRPVNATAMILSSIIENTTQG